MRRMVADKRFADPTGFAHIRRELGMDREGVASFRILPGTCISCCLVQRKSKGRNECYRLLGGPPGERTIR